MSLRRYGSLFLKVVEKHQSVFPSHSFNPPAFRSHFGKKWKSLYSLDLIGHHYRILLAYFSSSFCLVVICAVVLVRVPVNSTKKITTSTVKSCKTTQKMSVVQAIPDMRIIRSARVLPVRPTRLRQVKHLFFLGLEESGLLPSSLHSATGAGE